MTILDRLRSETRPWHEQVEQSFDLASRLASVDAFASLLARFYGYYEPLETSLLLVTGGQIAGLDLAPRLKCGLLRADLTALQWTPAAIDSLPRCDHLPSAATEAQSLGCLYVLEGATLGGQLVAREVGRRLGLGPATGCAFFTSYGKHTADMWHGFRYAAMAFAATTEVQDQVVRSAIETFMRLDAWLSKEARI